MAKRDTRAKREANARARSITVQGTALRTPSADSSGTGDGWSQLWAEFLAERPRCPDCGSDWDVEGAVEEEGATDDAWVLSVSVSCLAYEADEAAWRMPAPHPRTRGTVHYELARPIRG